MHFTSTHFNINYLTFKDAVYASMSTKRLQQAWKLSPLLKVINTSLPFFMLIIDQQSVWWLRSWSCWLQISWSVNSNSVFFANDIAESLLTWYRSHSWNHSTFCGCKQSLHASCLCTVELKHLSTSYRWQNNTPHTFSINVFLCACVGLMMICYYWQCWAKLLLKITNF